MIYFGNPSSSAIRAAMVDRDDFGAMVTPKQGNKIPAGVRVAVDNGCFSDPDGFGDGSAFLECLTSHPPDAVAFATSPDVVADWTATLDRSVEWLSRIRSANYRAAIVLQDGATIDTVPWSAADAVFVGGSTEWKLSPTAGDLVQEAARRGVWAHMGRVNSFRRLRLAQWFGCDSVDGTFLVFGPDVNLPKVTRWLDSVNTQPIMVER
jgi:hypothetical protein